MITAKSTPKRLRQKVRSTRAWLGATTISIPNGTPTTMQQTYTRCSLSVRPSLLSFWELPSRAAISRLASRPLCERATPGDAGGWAIDFGGVAFSEFERRGGRRLFQRWIDGRADRTVWQT